MRSPELPPGSVLRSSGVGVNDHAPADDPVCAFVDGNTVDHDRQLGLAVFVRLEIPEVARVTLAPIRRAVLLRGRVEMRAGACRVGRRAVALSWT